MAHAPLRLFRVRPRAGRPALHHARRPSLLPPLFRRHLLRVLRRLRRTHRRRSRSVHHAPPHPTTPTAPISWIFKVDQGFQGRSTSDTTPTTIPTTPTPLSRFPMTLSTTDKSWPTGPSDHAHRHAHSTSTVFRDDRIFSKVERNWETKVGPTSPTTPTLDHAHSPYLSDFPMTLSTTDLASDCFFLFD